MKVENSFRYFVVKGASGACLLASLKNESIKVFILSSLIVASMETGLLWRIPTRHSWIYDRLI